MKERIIAQGAEAVLIKKGNEIIKRRIKKGYRLKEIDSKLRRTRTKREAKLIKKCQKLINVSRLISVDENKKEIIMSFIDGRKLSECFDNLKNKEQIAKKIGKQIAKLHEQNIIHGDLTTSNMILVNREVFFIDFGLGFISTRIEDKAVDLHLLKQALEAKHFTCWKKLFNCVIEGYKIYKKSESVLNHLKIVEKRGRYKKH